MTPVRGKPILLYLTGGSVVKGYLNHVRHDVFASGPVPERMWLPVDYCSVLRPGDTTYVEVGALMIATDKIDAWRG